MRAQSFLHRTLPAILTLLGISVCTTSVEAAGYYLEDFDDGQAQNWTLGTSWTLDGAPDTGMYLAGAHSGRSYAIYENNTWETGYAYTVRVRSPDWGTQVGAVFNYQNGSNFYEVALSAQGAVTLSKIIAGVRSTVATASAASTSAYSGPLVQGRWTDVQVVRLGTKVTVRINGTPALTDISLNSTEVGVGRIGVMTNANTSWFDYAVVMNAATPYGPSFPRLATVRIGDNAAGTATDYDVPAVQAEIAKVDLALLHYSSFWQADHAPLSTVVSDLKTLNPSLKVVLYTKANEANYTNTGSEKTEPAVHAQIQAMDWWVRDVNDAPVGANYKPAIFKLVNLTRHVPKSNNMTWARWYAQWSYDNYMVPHPSVDGMYMDNVHWQPPATATNIANWDRVGAADVGTREDVRSWFRRGFRDYFDQIGSIMPSSKIKLANVATWGQTTPADNASLAEYYGAAHGGVIEALIAKNQSHSPEHWGGWQTMLNYYRKVMSAFAGQRLGIFMHGLTSATDYQDMRYGLASCMMDDGYYAPYVQSEGYSSTRWYDEFDANLGQATSPPPTAAWKNGIWRRNFQNGIVLVNPKGNGARVNVSLDGTFKKIDGTQSPVNDGTTVTTITLQDRDGIVLLNP